MQITPLALPGLLLIQLDVYRDGRGFFVERFNREKFKALDLPLDFVQDNHSRSAPGVLRGLHFQFEPSQGKLVSVTRGKIWDVCVDVRKQSSAFGKHLALELDDQSGQMLWVPPGFAHGFCVLGDSAADVLYKVDAQYEPQKEGGVHWADPELGIHWPLSAPIVSERDRKLPSFLAYRQTPGLF